jgi:enoyl-CoA hydratase/carnithine racemase
MNYQYIEAHLSDRVLTLTFNRPNELNRCNFAMLDEFGNLLEEANRNDEVKAVIVTGAGRAFCAGTDLSGEEGSFNESATLGDMVNGIPRDAGGRLSLQMFDYDKPLIAAINGPAVGYGVTMTLPMDIRIASTAARFGFVFSRRGLIPEACSTWFLPRIVGISRALEWFESGRILEADEALKANLVSEVVEPSNLSARANTIAHALIDRSSSVSIMIARRMMLQMLGPTTQ